MHYHLEIIMPPTDNVTDAIEEIMSPFCEYDENATHTFYDWYEIGGRWQGHKLTVALDEKQLDKFYDELKKRKITISGIQAGKQSLEPKSQIPEVDALWNEMFPDFPVKQCPMFDHYNGNHGDIMLLKDTPKDLTAARVIIAAPNHTGKLKAVYMAQEDTWNGVNYEQIKWDSKISSALKKHKEHIKTYGAEYIERCTPKKDWVCVTIDYHS